MKQKENLLLSVSSSTLNKDIDSDYQMFEKEEAISRIQARGFLYGQDMAQNIGTSGIGEDIGEDIGRFAVQSGFFLADTEETEDDVYTVTIKEAAVIDPHFLEGYISGIASEFAEKSMIIKVIEEGVFEIRPDNLEERVTPKTQPLPPPPEPKKESISSLKYEIIPGESYYLSGEGGIQIEKIFKVFEQEVQKGKPGLCISTNFPKKIQRKYDLVDTESIWLSTAGKGVTDIISLDPRRLDHEILPTLLNFMGGQEGIILLHGIEDLLRENSYDSTMKVLKRTIDLASARGYTILCPLEAKAFNETEFYNIKGSFEGELTVEGYEN